MRECNWPPQEQKSDKISLNALLYIALFVIFLNLSAYLWLKKPAVSAPILANPPNIQNVGDSEMNKHEETLRLVWERTKKNTDRLTLSAIIAAHNTCILQNGYPASEVIYIGSDWKIDRLPTRVDADAKTVEFLKDHLRYTSRQTALQEASKVNWIE